MHYFEAFSFMKPSEPGQLILMQLNPPTEPLPVSIFLLCDMVSFPWRIIDILSYSALLSQRLQWCNTSRQKLITSCVT